MERMPTDFRDEKTFPRRGREAIGEALWLLRVSDKGRASAAGTIHDYVYPCPMDQGMLERWSIAPAEFDEALRRHPTDEHLCVVQGTRASRERRDGQRVAAARARGEPRPSGRRRGRPGRAPLMGSTVEFVRPDGKTAPGYFAPAGADGAPGIVLFEEWWGLDDRIKSNGRLVSRRTASTSLVPDLYRGRCAATGDEANHLMEGLDFADAATQDAAGAASYLARTRRAARRRHRLLHGRRADAA